MGWAKAISVKTTKVPNIEDRETAGEMIGGNCHSGSPTEATVLCGHFSGGSSRKLCGHFLGDPSLEQAWKY